SPAHARQPMGPDLNLPAGRPLVLSVGRLSPEKNLPTIIEATARLKDLTPRPLLVIVGDGPERGRLEALAAGREDVRFVGALHGPSLQRLYARAAAFPFASEVDTFGLVALEAMASGAPLIVVRGASVTATLEHRRDAYVYDQGADG